MPSLAVFWLIPAASLVAAPFVVGSVHTINEPAPAALVANEVLSQNAGALTAYQASGMTTPGNDVSPRVSARAVNADGSQRLASSWGMAVGANPFGSNWRGSLDLNGVDLRTGSYSPTERDISLPTDGVAVGVGRSYNGQQWNGTSRVDSTGLQGNNWAPTGFPELLLWEHPSLDEEDIVYLHFGADRFVEFQRYDSTSTEFQGRQGTAGYVAFTGASGNDPELYVYTDRQGTRWTFFGYDSNAGNAAGQLWKAEDSAGNVAYVHDASSASSAANAGFDASGGAKEIWVFCTFSG